MPPHCTHDLCTVNMTGCTVNMPPSPGFSLWRLISCNYSPSQSDIISYCKRISEQTEQSTHSFIHLSEETFHLPSCICRNLSNFQLFLKKPFNFLAVSEGTFQLSSCFCRNLSTFQLFLKETFNFLAVSEGTFHLPSCI